ncbi:MAG: amino acid adenylation domain-containing protein, partial [bacterium]|nr:amino acid adenylation domain-containing protein [bacterium]
MSLIPFLAKLKSSGVTIRLEDENLKIKARDGALTPELVRQLKERKREIIDFLRQTGKGGSAAISPVEKKEYYPLSSPQERLYFLHRLEPGNVTYNMAQVIPLVGIPDAELFQSVFLQLVRRHESFRTSFHTVDRVPVQRVHDNVDFQVDFTAMAGPVVSPLVLSFIQYFDLSTAPLLRATVIRTGESEYDMVVDMHHIISDGTSMSILTREFLALLKGEEPAPLRLRYRDYVHWHRSHDQQERLKKEETYWLGKFPLSPPLLVLPTDYPRPRDRDYRGQHAGYYPDEAGMERLKELARREGATFYMGILTILYILLSKLGGQEDIVIGATLAGRRHADLEPIVGMFVNTLALRNSPTGEKTFTEFLRDVKEDTGQAFQNQQYHFEDLVEHLSIPRDLSRNPVFDVTFNMLTQEQDSTMVTGAGKIIPGKHSEAIVKFDLSFTAIETSDRLILKFEYCPALFKPGTIDRMMGYFDQILKETAANPDTRLSQIQWMPETEKRKVLTEWNDTAGEYPRDRTIHQLFEEQAERTPDNIALVFKGHSLSYRLLDHWANGLALELREKGVVPGTIAAIMMERSVETIIAIFAILKAGGAFLNLDANYPEERIRYMLEDSAAQVVVTKGLQVDRLDGSIEPANKSTNQLTNLAYIIYTSGSTGVPKGVVGLHTAMVNRSNWMWQTYPFKPGEVCCQKTSLNFVDCIWEIFGPLLKGVPLVILPGEVILDLPRFVHILKTRRVSRIVLVPGLLYRFFDEATQYYKELPHLTFWVTSGETLRPGFPAKFRETKPGSILLNLYGSSEVSADVTYYDTASHTAGSTRVPIGRPIHNTQIYILDKEQRPLPIGITGEIYVGGAGLAAGYINQPKLTKEKFIMPPAAKTLFEKRVLDSPKLLSKARLYRTGDLGRWLADGNIDFLGRADHQVKVRGYRIELGEIENRLLKHEQIKEAVVMAKQYESGDTYICAYLTGVEDDDGVGEEQLKEYLARFLPDYMVPSFFVSLETMPLNPSGKVDQKALSQLQVSSRERQDRYVAPRAEVERQLAAIWEDLLETAEPIGIDDGFFQLGGHSLRAMELTARIQKELNVTVPLKEIFNRPTVRGLALYIKEASLESHIAIEPVEKREYYPLTSAQKRLYFLQQMDVNNTPYNMPVILTLGKNTRKEELEEVLKKLILRHESLRTSFRQVAGQPVQRVHDYEELFFEVTEVTGAGAGKGNGHPVSIRDYVRPFDLSRAPLMRSVLIRDRDGNCTWLVDIHHIISDGTSGLLLKEEFIDLYNGRELEPPKLRIQYKDFSLWQNRLLEGGNIQNQWDYWLDLFADAEDIRPLRLPADHERPGVFTFAGHHWTFGLETSVSSGFKALSSRFGGTLYMSILAALNTLFYRYTGQTDIIIGSGAAGRPHVDLQRVIGMFVNTL